MAAPIATFLSYRLGGTDGVSVEAAKWEWALHELGFVTRRVAGELDGIRKDDTWLAFLSIDPPRDATVEPDVLAAALAGSDLVVVENICSLPLNATASTTAADVLSRHHGRILFHHHDFQWERPHLAPVDGIPPDLSGVAHVTISEHGRASLEERGFRAHTIRNSFDFSPLPGDRDAARAAVGVADDLLVLQPTRAIPRKRVDRGIRFAEQLDDLLTDRRVVYWLTGPAEDGFGPELERIGAGARLKVVQGRLTGATDAYAAADVVVFPSEWEGFGNPVVEATIARRPLAVAHYPVLDELLGLGLRPFSVENPSAVAAWLAEPDEELMDANIAALQPELDIARLPERIHTVLTQVGWDRW